MICLKCYALVTFLGGNLFCIHPRGWLKKGFFLNSFLHFLCFWGIEHFSGFSAFFTSGFVIIQFETDSGSNLPWEFMAFVAS
jgi:hypothetical protein